MTDGIIAPMWQTLDQLLRDPTVEGMEFCPRPAFEKVEAERDELLSLVKDMRRDVARYLDAIDRIVAGDRGRGRMTRRLTITVCARCGVLLEEQGLMHAQPMCDALPPFEARKIEVVPAADHDLLLALVERLRADIRFSPKWKPVGWAADIDATLKYIGEDQ